MKFKVGDSVRIKDTAGKTDIRNIGFSEKEMGVYRNQVKTVIDFSFPFRGYRLEDCGRNICGEFTPWMWAEEWLEAPEEPSNVSDDDVMDLFGG